MATDLAGQSASRMPTLTRAGDKKLLFQAIPKSRLSSDLLEQKTTLWRAEVSRSVKKHQFQGVRNTLFPLPRLACSDFGQNSPCSSDYRPPRVLRCARAFRRKYGKKLSIFRRDLDLRSACPIPDMDIPLREGNFNPVFAEYGVNGEIEIAFRS
jgi:hypothetical protein